MKWIDEIKKGAASLVRRLPSPLDRLPEEWKQNRLREDVKQAFLDRPVPSESPYPKVFGIGLSRTGTTSLAQALRVLGYETASWKRNGQRILGWPEFYRVDAATDTPCASQFESLYHAFEGSKFIYTTRDPERWSQSVKDLFGVTDPRKLREWWSSSAFWKEEYAWDWYNSLRYIQIHESLYAQHSTWQDAYEAHDRRVRTFFQDKPSDRFLEMKIVEGEKWDTLCPFLDLELPDSDFPHENRKRTSEVTPF